MAWGDEGPPNTWRRYLYEWMPNIFRRYWGVRFAGGYLGGLYDNLSQGLLDAVKAYYHQETNGPAYDALRFLGNEMSMPQYPIEGWVGYRDRLRTSWDTWAKAGTQGTIEAQLALAGAPGAYAFQYGDDGSWSEFIVFFPSGTHTITNYASFFGGGGTFGDGTNYGPNNITAPQLWALKDLIVHWKAAHWKCRYIVWETSGETYGTGHTFGEAGLTYGGTQVRTEVQI